MRGLETILVIGASGQIGRAFLGEVTGVTPQSRVPRAVQLRRRINSSLFDVTGKGDVDLTTRGALVPWLNAGLEAVVFLAGVSSDMVRRNPELALAIHLQSLVELLEWSCRSPNPPRIIYASSTAIHSTDSSNAYGAQKLAAEMALSDSGIVGLALRFPTVVPRPHVTSSATQFLNIALARTAARLAYTWPIDLDREIRLMSTIAAARHIKSALAVPLRPKAFALDLPATVVTPNQLFEAGQIPEIYRISSTDITLDKRLAKRPVHLSCSGALRMGFGPEESVLELLSNFSLGLRYDSLSEIEGRYTSSTIGGNAEAS